MVLRRLNLRNLYRRGHLPRSLRGAQAHRLIMIGPRRVRASRKGDALKLGFATQLPVILAVLGACTGCANATKMHTADMAEMDCISANGILQTRVRSDSRIDFHTGDGQRFINHLPASCRNLDYEGRYSFAKSGERICAGDSIIVANRAHGPGEPDGMTCALGHFTPVASDVSL